MCVIVKFGKAKSVELRKSKKKFQESRVTVAKFIRRENIQDNLIELTLLTPTTHYKKKLSTKIW